MTQISIPCSVYRGGTSRGLFFHEADLPEESEMRNHIFLHGIDAFNPSQINGLGSGTSHSSKVVVIGKSNRPNVHIEYTFYQIGIGTQIVDDKGTCGNLMAAVGAFAVNEGLVACDLSANTIEVSVFNTNIAREVIIHVPVEKGKAKVDGDYFMPGIVTPGSKYTVNIMYPGAAKTKHTLPLDNIYILKADENSYDTSFIDVVNPFVYVYASAFNLTGNEPFQKVANNEEIIDRLNTIRNEAAIAVGFADTTEEAKHYSSAIPKIAMVAKTQDYITTSGKEIKAEEIDILAKMISMKNLHRTFAGSGLYNLAAATLLRGTVPNQVAKLTYEGKNQLIRIGHPDGVAEVMVTLTEDKKDVLTVGLERTARQIMKGQLYIPEKMGAKT